MTAVVTPVILIGYDAHRLVSAEHQIGRQDQVSRLSGSGPGYAIPAGDEGEPQGMRPS